MRLTLLKDQVTETYFISAVIRQCRGVQRFPLSSVGEHIPPWEGEADQEDMDRLERKFAENDIICCARKIQP